MAQCTALLAMAVALGAAMHCAGALKCHSSGPVPVSSFANAPSVQCPAGSDSGYCYKAAFRGKAVYMCNTADACRRLGAINGCVETKDPASKDVAVECCCEWDNCNTDQYTGGRSGSAIAANGTGTGGTT